jgi:hypothetical protein
MESADPFAAKKSLALWQSNSQNPVVSPIDHEVMSPLHTRNAAFGGTRNRNESGEQFALP